MDEYQQYLEDQKGHALSGACDDKYLDYLSQVIIPGINLSSLKVLDVGCNKFLSYNYFKNNFNNEIDGICISKDGLNEAWKNNRPAQELDAHEMDAFLKHEYYDLILAFHSFEHMFDLPKVLNNCNKLLNPKGLVYFAVPMPSINWHKKHWYDIPTVEEADRLMSSAGFNKVYLEVIFCKIRPEQELIALYKKEQ